MAVKVRSCPSESEHGRQWRVVAHARGGAERGCDGREHGDHNVVMRL